ncbi:MAG TPA: helix-turn-helix domain-containing protein [Steroidobacteraceae bacterium]|jgi:AcrR family transcriptional regulator|nr:helix-turn-helix domain-containing protein [Steroidobacteraceae bacterium]
MQIDDISEGEQPRHEALLEAAVGVFARYGFRKTSMDEVARAAGVSRQGLYLLFADKEELFRRAVVYKLTRQLSAAVAELSNERNSLEQRLMGACDEWAGRYVGMFGGDTADLMCASTSLAGGTLTHYEAQFEKALADAIGGSALAKFCTAAGLLPVDAARALHATARGLKHSSKSREEFAQAMTAAVRMFCAPLNPRPPHQE